MIKICRSVRVEWSDCDPAGIVHFPRYFEMCDASTTRMVEDALGRLKRQIINDFNITGWSLVASRVQFILPLTFGDDVEIESQLLKYGRSSFEIQHRILKNGDLHVEALETRVWVGVDLEGDKVIASRPLPKELIKAFLNG